MMMRMNVQEVETLTPLRLLRAARIPTLLPRIRIRKHKHLHHIRMLWMKTMTIKILHARKPWLPCPRKTANQPQNLHVHHAAPRTMSSASSSNSPSDHLQHPIDQWGLVYLLRSSTGQASSCGTHAGKTRLEEVSDNVRTWDVVSGRDSRGNLRSAEGAEKQNIAPRAARNERGRLVIGELP